MDYLNSKIQLFLEIELLDLFYWLLLLLIQLPSSSTMYVYCVPSFLFQSIRRMGMISDANTTYFFSSSSPKVYMGRICVSLLNNIHRLDLYVFSFFRSLFATSSCLSCEKKVPPFLGILYIVDGRNSDLNAQPRSRAIASQSTDLS